MAPSGKWIEGIGPESAVDDAARRSLEARLATVSHCLPLAAHLAEHDIEHVHRLRVATRRAVAAVKLYRELLPRKKARWLKKRLRKIRRAAGEARDLDVLAERLQREFPELAPSVLPLVAGERAAAQPAIIEVAEDARRDDRFVRKTAKLLNRVRPPECACPPEQTVRFKDWASSQLARIADAFFAASPGETADMAAMHQFRIRAKALRYAMELLAPGLPTELVAEQYPVIKELQEYLGRINDRVASAERFRRWAKDAKDDAQRQSLERLISADAAQLADDLRHFKEWWSADRLQRLRESFAATSSQHE